MTIEEQINQCMIVMQHWFRREYKQASKLASPLREEKLQELILKINESILVREKRKENIPNIVYPDLPISAQKDDILKAILENQVVIVAGETGSGKTTQLPKICLQAGLGIGGLIGHTQPRRIAARTVAARIASEFESPLGKHVGFKVRFSDNSQKDNYLKIMTDGILLSETQNDKYLSQYDCIIIDEAHERSLNIDFLLGYLKKLIAKRKDLKVIITSATIDVKRFSEFFDDAPIIEVKGRSYPVETLYLDKDFHDESDDPILQVANAVKLACQRGPGDILVFQSGEKEIREVIELLTYQKMNNVELLPLFSRQSNAEQQKIFQRSNKRKIIVTTNVAETSLTVPNIRFVIDSGLARISRYNYRNKLQRLPIEAISQASADQRKGRCGRVGPGVCFRLYREEDYLTRTPFTEPEILRTNLAGVILKMLSLDFESIDTFEFIEPPDSRYFKDGFTLLERLQAVDENKKITKIGRVLATIPIEPKLGRIIIAANTFGALNEILIITSALSIIDVRERPQGNQSEADLAHAKFAHQTSDFMSILNLWQFIIEHKIQLSHQKMRKLCKENYLSFLRVLEWIDVYQQLVQITAEHNFKLNQVPADYALIHKSLLVGFIDSIGVKEEKQEYTGARNVKFFIHPQSTLFKRAPSWILSSEIVHTSKTFARMNGAIETKWIEEVADSLLKKQYDEPHFEPKSGRVVAFERASLFGLEIYAKKKINYEKVAPKEARKIFIEQALIQEQMKQPFAFYIKNKETVKRIIQSEDRIRKKLILFDDTKLLAFYESKIPFYVCSVPALEKYLKDKTQDFLEVKQSEILLNEISDNLNNLFPEKLVVKEQPFCLEYQFDLSSENDGATLIVPFELLQYIKDEDFSWVIPGLLEEKIDFLIRALPKKNRTQFVPIPEFAKKARQNISPKQGTLTTTLQKYLEKEQGSAFGAKLWEHINYPWHLVVHFKVLDKQGNIVGQGDDLEKLYHQLKEHYLEIYSSEQPIERENVTQWDFTDLPVEYKVKRGKLDFIYYPALVDNQNSISVKLFDSLAQAEYYHRIGIARLYLLCLNDACKNVKKNISQQIKKQLSRSYEQRGSFDALLDEIFLSCSLFLFVDNNSRILKQSEFAHILSLNRTQFVLTVNQTVMLVNDIFCNYQIMLTQLERKAIGSLDKDAFEDIKQQLENLMMPQFIRLTPLIWLKRYPVYFKALMGRIEKFSRQISKDKDARKEVMMVSKAYISKLNTKDVSFMNPGDPIINFRWKIEEFRISLFAQELKTAEPVSKVRLLKLLENID